MKQEDFECVHCRRHVAASRIIGTSNVNHCPHCLWSKHIDLNIPGDRKAFCKKAMKPVGLTFKREGTDKYGNLRQGELMLIHICEGCSKICINRVSGTDKPEEILKILKDSENLPTEIKDKIKDEGITMLAKKDFPEVSNQLYGR